MWKFAVMKVTRTIRILRMNDKDNLEHSDEFSKIKIDC